MRWSAHKTKLLSFFASSLVGHVDVFLTHYESTRGARVGRGWITLDGQELVSFGPEPIDGIPASDRFFQAVADYPNLDPDTALASENSIIRALAMFDRRVGKRRLVSLAESEALDPLQQQLLRIRENHELRQQKNPKAITNDPK